MVRTHKFDVRTKGQGDAHDITPAVNKVIQEAGFRDGIATVFFDTEKWQADASDAHARG